MEPKDSRADHACACGNGIPKDQVLIVAVVIDLSSLSGGEYHRRTRWARVWITINSMKSAFLPYEQRCAFIYTVIKPGYARVRTPLVTRHPS